MTDPRGSGGEAHWKSTALSGARVGRWVRDVDRWRLDAADVTVEQCMVDFGFSLLLGSSIGYFTLRGEEDFDLEIDGHRQVVRPGERPVIAVAPALELWRRGLVELSARDDGCLDATFTDHAAIAVGTNEMYEAWTLTAPDGSMTASIPGGALSFWPPRPKAEPDAGATDSS